MFLSFLSLIWVHSFNKLLGYKIIWNQGQFLEKREKFWILRSNFQRKSRSLIFFPLIFRWAQFYNLVNSRDDWKFLEIQPSRRRRKDFWTPRENFLRKSLLSFSFLQSFRWIHIYKLVNLLTTWQFSEFSGGEKTDFSSFKQFSLHSFPLLLFSRTTQVYKLMDCLSIWWFSEIQVSFLEKKDRFFDPWPIFHFSGESPPFVFLSFFSLNSNLHSYRLVRYLIISISFKDL